MRSLAALSIGVAVVIFGISCCSSVKPCTSVKVLPQGFKKIVCVPLASINVSTVDTSTLSVSGVENDSFYISAVNGILAYESGRKFVMCREKDVLNDSVRAQLLPLSYLLSCGSTQFGQLGEHIRRLCASSGADLVILPICCSVTQKLTIGPDNERTRSEAAYGIPLVYIVESSVHIQLWSKEGTMLFERVGTACITKPLFPSAYSKFHDEPDGQVSGKIKKPFASHVIKSINRAIVDGLNDARQNM